MKLFRGHADVMVGAKVDSIKDANRKIAAWVTGVLMQVYLADVWLSKQRI